MLVNLVGVELASFVVFVACSILSFRYAHYSATLIARRLQAAEA